MADWLGAVAGELSDSSRLAVAYTVRNIDRADVIIDQAKVKLQNTAVVIINHQDVCWHSESR
jgi:hypothetical protein